MTSPNNQIAILACRQPEHAKIADFINCTASQPYNSRDMSSCDMSTGPSRAEIPHRGDINTLKGEYHRNTHADISRLAVLRTWSPLRRLQDRIYSRLIKDRIRSEHGMCI